MRITAPHTHRKRERWREREGWVNDYLPVLLSLPSLSFLCSNFPAFYFSIKSPVQGPSRSCWGSRIVALIYWLLSCRLDSLSHLFQACKRISFSFFAIVCDGAHTHTQTDTHDLHLLSPALISHVTLAARCWTSSPFFLFKTVKVHRMTSSRLKQLPAQWVDSDDQSDVSRFTIIVSLV